MLLCLPAHQDKHINPRQAKKIAQHQGCCPSNAELLLMMGLSTLYAIALSVLKRIYQAQCQLCPNQIAISRLAESLESEPCTTLKMPPSSPGA